MHAIRRALCTAVIALVAIEGIRIVWRVLREQTDRFAQVTGLGPAFHDPSCQHKFCDYTLFWLVGRLAAQTGAASVYHPARAFAGPAQILPDQALLLPFMYPPQMLPLTFLIALPPISVSYYAFEIISITTAAFLLRRASLSWFVIAAGLLSPAAIYCAYYGEFGIICGALLAAGLLHLQTNPRTGGALLALLCIKPQYGLLAPVLFFARRDRRAWTAATAVLAALSALSLLCFGWSSWSAFLGPDHTAIRAWLQRPFGHGDQMNGTSVFWMARSFGAGMPLAYAIQLCCSAAAAFCAWQLWRRGDVARETRAAVTICLCLLASPYSYDNDMIAYSIACAMLFRRDPSVPDVLLALLWLAPGYTVLLTQKLGFLPTPLWITAAALIGWQRAREDFTPASPALTGRRSAPVLSLSPTPTHRFR
jgi:hypothetical protein